MMVVVVVAAAAAGECRGGTQQVHEARVLVTWVDFLGKYYIMGNQIRWPGLRISFNSAVHETMNAC